MGLVNVRLFANLREIVGQPHLAVEAGTIRDVPRGTSGRTPGIAVRAL